MIVEQMSMVMINLKIIVMFSHFTDYKHKAMLHMEIANERFGQT